MSTHTDRAASRTVLDHFVKKDLRNLNDVQDALVDQLKILRSTPTTLREQGRIEHVRGEILSLKFSTKDHWVRLLLACWPSDSEIVILRPIIKKGNRLSPEDIRRAEDKSRRIETRNIRDGNVAAPLKRDKHHMIDQKSDAPDALDSLLADNPELAKRSNERRGLAEVASLLLQLRQVTGLTQAELARRAGVTKTLISELENAANDGVTLRTLVRIARGAEASVEIKFILGKESGAVCTELNYGQDRCLATPIRVVTTESTSFPRPLAA